MRGRGALLWIVALLAVAAPAAAQDAYPNRPIRWVVPFPAGGPTDTLSRILAAKLGDVWKSGIVIENKGGAAGAIGTDFTAKSAPDGYTIMLGTQSTNASNKIFYPNLPYDPITDFEPLTLLGTACMVLVIPTSIPVNNAKELVEWIKKQEAPAAYAAVTGSSQHIAAELLAKRAGLKATLVPYRGSAQAQPDLIAGRIVYMFDNLPSALPQARAGKVKALAQTCATRSPSAPELPTMVEAGFADFVVDGWYGMFAPVKTPKAIVDKLNAEMVKALNSSEMKERMALQGMDPAPSTPAELTAFVKAESAKWAKVAKDSGATAE